MSGPWEKYQETPTEGPWTKYAVPVDENTTGSDLKGKLEKFKSFYKSYQDNPLIKYGPNLPQTMGEIGQNLANKAGEATTEYLGGKQVNPNISAGVGTAIQIAPQAIAAIGGGLEAHEAGQAGNLGMAGRVISGPSRAEAGAAIGSAEKAVGVNSDILPTMKDMGANLGIKNPNTEQYLNALSERLKSGEELGPQALSQHHKMIAKILSRESSGLAGKLGFKSAKSIGEPAIAQAAKINRMLVEKLNEAAPGRESAAALYRAANIRNTIYKAVGSAAATAVGGSPLIKALMKSTGGD